MSHPADDSGTGGAVYNRVGNRWYVPAERHGQEAHEMVTAIVRRLENLTDGRYAQLQLYEQVYSDYPFDTGFTSDSYDQYGVNYDQWQGEITLNVTRSMVSAITSKLTKDFPLPAVQTTRGSWSDHRKGKKLGQFLEGDFADDALKQCFIHAFVDCCIYDAGFIKTFIGGPEKDPKVISERVKPEQIFMDPADAATGRPQQIFQKTQYDRAHLMDLFPGQKDKIKNARRSEYFEEYDAEVGEVSDLVDVFEAWRLNGRHVMCTENATLVDEEWPYPWLPFSKLIWTIEPNEYFGRGLVSELMPLQSEINRLAAHIQDAFHMGSNWVWAVERGSEVKDEELGNLNGTIIEYTDRPPQRMAQSVVPAEVFAHLDRLWARAFDIAGVSELAVAARKPAGLDSGKALDTFHDIGTERFARVARNWEATHKQVAEQRIAMYRTLAKRGKKVRIPFMGTQWKEDIEFPNLDETKYTFRITPISSFSASLPGRIKEVEHLVNMGLMSERQDILRNLRLGEVNAYTDLETAQRETAEMVCEEILETGVPVECEPEWDATICRRVAVQTLVLGRQHNIPQELAGALRSFIKSCDEVLKAQLQQAMAEQAALAPPPAPGAPAAGPAPALPPEGGSPIPPEGGGLPPLQ